MTFPKRENPEEEYLKKINKCDSLKEIGDKVIFWNIYFNFNRDLELKAYYPGDHPIFKEPLIIIKNDIMFGFNPYDLLVYSPKNKRKIETRLAFVRLADKRVIKDTNEYFEDRYNFMCDWYKKRGLDYTKDYSLPSPCDPNDLRSFGPIHP